MSDDTETPQQLVPPVLKLDEQSYDLSEEERGFLKGQIGIQEDDELKAHVLQLQAEAYKVRSLRSSYLRESPLTLIL
jgi:hypothetical protein